MERLGESARLTSQTDLFMFSKSLLLDQLNQLRPEVAMSVWHGNIVYAVQLINTAC